VVCRSKHVEPLINFGIINSNTSCILLVFLLSHTAMHGSMDIKVKVLLCILGNTRPGQKVSELSSEGAVQRHCGARGQTVLLNFYLGATIRLHDEVRRNSQEITVYWIFESRHTLWSWPKLCSRCWPNTTFNRCVSHKTLTTRLHAIFPLIHTQRTLWEVNRLKMRNNQNERHTAASTDAPNRLPEVLPAGEGRSGLILHKQKGSV
jgi:hypothetical protein